MRFTFLLLLLTFLIACGEKNPPVSLTPALPEGDAPSDEDDAELRDSLKKEYQDLLYHADPWVDVEALRAANYRRNLARKQTLRTRASGRSTVETFAGNKITAEWHERGPNNESGDMREATYDPVTGDIWATSVGGGLWKGDLNGSWELIDDDRIYGGGVLHRVPHGTGTRMFACHGPGTGDKIVQYSDDDGVTWTAGNGFNLFYDHWGEGKEFYTFADTDIIFYLVHTWSSVGEFGEKNLLYMSTDKGVSYTNVYDSGIGYNSQSVDMWKPEGEDKIFLFDNNAQSYREITYNAVTESAVITAPLSYSAAGVTTGDFALTGKYNTTTQDYDLYLLTESDERLYKTSDGVTFTTLGTATESVWRKAFLADPNNDNIYVGGFQMSKSTDGGSTFSDLYGSWTRYYYQSKDSLHVDQMNLKYFEQSDGTPFLMSLNHAGIFISYDGFLNSQNITQSGMRAVTLYDQTTAADGFLYCGAQDKGTFVAGGSTADFSLIDTDNRTTGDGMVGSFFNGDQSIVAMLQNSKYALIADRDVDLVSYHEIPGNHRPGWITPMVSTPDPADNKVYIAGGNINGGSGSYLVEMTVNINGNNGTPVLSQFNYDFRANSDAGNSVIKAIGVSNADDEHLFVATQDATFFYSTDRGSTWTKSAHNFPSAFIPWEIITSETDEDEIYISGTGNSNAGVFMSTDGGVSFTALSAGAPSATYYEVALDDTEGLLFAATSDGPYVYVFEDAQWFPLMGADTPLVDYNSVDNVGNDVIRFGTYGRGVWDFKIQSLALPAELIAFNAESTDNKTAEITFTTAQEINVQDFDIQHLTGNNEFRTVGTVAAAGNSDTARDYVYTHQNPAAGENYYRLKINDRDGKIAYSDIRVVDIKKDDTAFALYPNPLPTGADLQFKTDMIQPFDLEIFDTNGRTVFVRRNVNPENTLSLDLPGGTYFFRAAVAERILAGGNLVVR